MLAMRLQRLGRTGHSVYRLVVQESQKNPSNGRVVAYVGTYDPHTKELNIVTDEVQRYLDNGAQPSDRVVKILKGNKEIKLPKWVKLERPVQNKVIRNLGKLRRNQPKEEAAPAEPAEATEATPAE